ncbi:MAG: F0F1 ATP synthase subunit epsilon [Bacteroidota bacterium]
MHLVIRTPDKQLFAGEIQHVTLPGAQGPFQVWPGHAPIATTLAPGNVVYTDAQQTHGVATGPGLATVHANQVTVLIHTGSASPTDRDDAY